MPMFSVAYLVLVVAAFTTFAVALFSVHLYLTLADRREAKAAAGRPRPAQAGPAAETGFRKAA